jgi:acyl-CoA reductase-like NAD-dependent aldehyde dehydrogenase
VYIGMPMHACQEAVQRADARPPFAFQAAVLTRDLARPMRTYQRLDPVALVINNHTAFRIDGMPFAGLSQSDLGVGDIFHTFRDMQIEKLPWDRRCRDAADGFSVSEMAVHREG